MSMIGPVVGGAGKAAAKAAPVVKKAVKKAAQTLEQQIDELEKRLAVGRQKFKETTDPVVKKKIADFGISLKKKLDGLKDELTAKTTSEGQVLRSGRINNRSQSTIESKGVTGKKQNKSANKPKTLGDTRNELESEFNRISRQLAVLLKQKPQTPKQKEKISQAIERLSDEKMAIIKQRRLLIQRANEIKKKMAKDSISKGKK
jgi:hypothetical protein